MLKILISGKRNGCRIIFFFDFQGCWQGNVGTPAQPASGVAAEGRDCVVGNPARKGFWANFACSRNVASICERDVPSETTPSPLPSSVSTCLQSRTTIMMGILFTLLSIMNL